MSLFSPSSEKEAIRALDRIASALEVLAYGTRPFAPPSSSDPKVLLGGVSYVSDIDNVKREQMAAAYMEATGILIDPYEDELPSHDPSKWKKKDGL